jgi:16S rRNA (cytidine1402-2'-O)-methyltransferase
MNGEGSNGTVARTPGNLLLLPTLIADCTPERVLPARTIDAARATSHFLAENARSARAFLKAIGHPQPIASLSIVEIGHLPDPARCDAWLQPLLDGTDVALLSEAGCPAVADPGAVVVARAHELGLSVRPLVGPSSLLLGLMISGMSGQRFRFVGYLPQDRSALAAALRELEEASHSGETQLFIETPYRNARLLQAVFETCRPDTRLGVAVDLSGDGEQSLALPIARWKAMPAGARPDLERRPAVFALCAAQPVALSGGRTTPSGRQ